MSKARRFASLVVVGSVLVAGLPSPGSATEPPVLATGRMTLVGSDLSYTELTLPSPARLSLNYFTEEAVLPTPRFSAGTGAAAVLLVSKEHRNEAWTAVRLPGDSPVLPHTSMGHDLCHVEDHCELAAGDYLLFLVTAEPVRVRLELRGLTGSSKVKLTQPATGDVGTATESYLHSSPGGPVAVAAHGAGYSPSLSGAGNYLFTAFWFRGPSNPVGPPPADLPLLQLGHAGGCRFEGSPSAESYAPGCPGGGMNGNFSSARALTRFGYLQWSSRANLPAGDYAEGYYAVHTGIHDPGFLGFWIDLGPT